MILPDTSSDTAGFAFNSVFVLHFSLGKSSTESPPLLMPSGHWVITLFLSPLCRQSLVWRHSCMDPVLSSRAQQGQLLPQDMGEVVGRTVPAGWGLASFTQERE